MEEDNKTLLPNIIMTLTPNMENPDIHSLLDSQQSPLFQKGLSLWNKSVS